MEWFEDSALTIATFVPIVGAIIMLVIPKDKEDQLKATALILTLISLAVGIGILFQYDYSRAGLQFEVDASWISAINARYHVGIDGISLPLYMMTLGITVLCVIYSWNHFPEPHNPKMFLILLLILETGMLGTFVALDLILFFVFFEIVLLPMYFLIGIWGGPNRKYASIKFFLFTLFGSAFMLVSFIALYFLAEPHTFDIVRLADEGLDIARSTAVWVFAGLFLGFAIKVPMFPFHTWLPDAHTEAPTVGSVVLAAVLLKLGTYGFVRIALPILPEAAQTWAPWIGLLAVIGIIYGSLCCLAQTDFKRLIAFSSVGHMGFVMLGIATLTPTGINAAIFGMVAHGIVTGMLFFVAGSMHERYHTRDIPRLGGMISSIPRLAGILVLISFASLGLPALAGFPGEFTSMLAAYEPAAGLDAAVFRTFLIVAAIGTVLTAGYMLYMLQRVAQGPIPVEWEGKRLHDVNAVEYVSWVPLIALTVVLGVFPGIVFNVTNETVAPFFSGIFG
ncbi:MAG: NADH-quinone oxidoreductase subunit M [Acidimicrobiia bacterium]|nr:NADH-quinone oxidoreductase subunit M [Acidimicrobiia bacterium]